MQEIIFTILLCAIVSLAWMVVRQSRKIEELDDALDDYINKPIADINGDGNITREDQSQFMSDFNKRFKKE